MSNSDFYNKWQEDKNFIIDNDKLKDRRFVFSSLPKCNNYGFQNGKIRPLIYGDIIARFNRLLNRNVLFPVGINTLSQQSFLESRKQYNMLNDELSDLDVRWHFIGHLQRNKCKQIINKIDFCIFNYFKYFFI